MTDAIYYPKELGDVLDKALDRCIERIMAGDEESVAFLVIMNSDGEITVQRIAASFTAESVEPINSYFDGETANIKIYALAFIAFLRCEGKDRKAILIEVGEQGNDESMVLSQRYKTRKKSTRILRLQGRLELVGMRESRLCNQN